MKDPDSEGVSVYDTWAAAAGGNNVMLLLLLAKYLFAFLVFIFTTFVIVFSLLSSFCFVGLQIQRLGRVDSDFAPFVQHAGVPSVDVYYGKGTYLAKLARGFCFIYGKSCYSAGRMVGKNQACGSHHLWFLCFHS